MPITISNKPSKKSLDSFLSGKCIFLVPNQSTLLNKQRFFLRNHANTLWKDKIFTPKTLIQFLSTTPKANINKNLQTLIIYYLLKKTELKHFEHVKKLPQICNEFTYAINALRENGTSSDSLKNELTLSGSLKEFDLLTIYKKYEDYIVNEKLFDTGSIIENILEIKEFPFEYLVIEGFEYIPSFVKKAIKHLNAKTNIEIIIENPTHSPTHKRFLKFQELNLKDVGLDRPQSISTPCKPMISFHSCISVMNETKFIASKIANIDSTVLINNDISYLNELLLSLYKFNIISKKSALEYTGKVSLIRNILKKSIDLNDLTSSLISFSKKLYKSLNDSDFTYHSSRNLTQISNLIGKLNFLEQKSCMEFDFDEIKNFLIHELNNSAGKSISLQNLPINITMWGDSIQETCKRLFIPNFCQGNIPPEPKPPLFFQDISFYPGNAPIYFAELFMPTDISRSLESLRMKRYLEGTEKEVILSYPRVDDQGKETSPSNILTGLEFSEYFEETILNPVNFSEKEIKKIESSVESEFNDKNRNENDAKSIVQDEKVKQELATNFLKKSFSASQLEKYARCPYQYFLSYAAKLEPLEPPAPDIRPRHRGTIIHYIMELFYKNDLETLLKFMRNEIEFQIIEDKIREYTEKAIEENRDSLKDTHQGLVQVFKSRAIKICIHAVRLEIDLLLAMEYPMLPKYTEWEFGINDKPYLEIKDAPLKEKALIKGVIDRIDIDEESNTFAITDYKTGSTSSILSKIKKGEHLQIPIYIRAARELLLRDQKPVAGFLFSLKNMEKKHGIGIKDFKNYYFKKINPRLFLKEEEWDKIINMAITVAAEYIQKIRDAEFIENTKNCARLCDYREICRYGK